MQEFKLQANQLSAEYGNMGSSVVNFTIRSGTNELHGSAFEIYRNNVLDARSWLGETRPPLRQNEFGFTVGSPVVLPKVSSRFDEVTSRVAQLFPAPNLSGAGALNYQAFQGERRLDPDTYIIKINHDFFAELMFWVSGRSHYHGGSVRLKKRFASGLLAEGHYTWSKNLGYSDTGAVGFGANDNVLQNNYTRSAEFSLLPNDIPHALVFYCAYELPFGKGKPFLSKGGAADKLLGGWLISGAHRDQTGMPLQIEMNNNLPLFSRNLRPDAVAGSERQTDVRNADFNPGTDTRINREAFASPAPFSFGSAAPSYGDMRNFPVLSEDFSLIKNTSLTERFEMELSAQFINAFNRRRFTGINQNFTNAQFESITGVSLPRTITLGLRLRY